MVREYRPSEMGFSRFFLFFLFPSLFLSFFFFSLIISTKRVFSFFLSLFFSKYSDEILTRAREARENSKIVLSKKRREKKKKDGLVDYSFSLVSKYQEREREREISRGFSNVSWNLDDTRSYVTHKPLTYSSAHKCRSYISTTSWVISNAMRFNAQRFDDRSVGGEDWIKRESCIRKKEDKLWSHVWPILIYSTRSGCDSLNLILEFCPILPFVPDYEEI